MELTVKFPHAELGEGGTYAVIHEQHVSTRGCAYPPHRIGPLDAGLEEVCAALRQVLAFRYPIFGTPPLTQWEIAAVERALNRKIAKLRKRRLVGMLQA